MMKPSNKLSEGALLENLISDNVENNQYSDNPYQGIELEPLHISIGKRFYSQFSYWFMFGNSINSIFTISAAVSLIPEYNYSEYEFCDYGTPISIGVQCPYLPSPVFSVFIVIWSIYYFTLIGYHMNKTYEYWSNDLRFYMICETIRFETFMLVMAFIGFILTIVSSLTGLYYVSTNGSTSSIGNIILYFFVNMLFLKNMISGTNQKLNGVDLEKNYPKPIIIDLSSMASPRNLNGIIIQHQNVFDYIQQAVLTSILTKEDSPLEKIGNPAQLKEVIIGLLPEEFSRSLNKS